jgi:hypothetical protein
MLIIGCDYHPSVQQIAFVDTETGDYGEQRLKHSDREAEKFYRDLKLGAVSVRVGLEATGHTRWFDCWRSWAMSCGLEMRPRSQPCVCGNRRLTGKTPSFC